MGLREREDAVVEVPFDHVQRFFVQSEVSLRLLGGLIILQYGLLAEPHAVVPIVELLQALGARTAGQGLGDSFEKLAVDVVIEQIAVIVPAVIVVQVVGERTGGFLIARFQREIIESPDHLLDFAGVDRQLGDLVLLVRRRSADRQLQAPAAQGFVHLGGQEILRHGRADNDRVVIVMERESRVLVALLRREHRLVAEGPMVKLQRIDEIRDERRQQGERRGQQDGQDQHPLGRFRGYSGSGGRKGGVRARRDRALRL